MPLDFDGLTYSWDGRPLFQDFALSVAENSVVALLGTSGCGKTTLLRLIAGTLKGSGTGNSPGPGPGAGRAAEGWGPGRISFIFQEPRLFPWHSALENVALPLRSRLGVVKARERALHFLRLVGLAGKEREFPDKLSGGERQRVSIARAFAFPAPLVLMDEPFQSLDLPLRIQLMDATLELLKAEPRTVLAVTHDPREAIYLADRAVVIAGRPVRKVADETIDLSRNDRAYSSAASAGIEARLFAALTERTE
ncbi:MAG TPA: ABC transporter ATP-binding protein [Treponema sp.]|nr:MAG: hypothetical protein A2Y36_12925 [Treponema sp. GWA1_62_8]OHE67450.1 MAG: hypothetical protein A2001_07565 [Treponema sp. GWC1_61_84]HCM28392.1 ABC transporter ATP-binding protein [Treponema sp.]